MQQTIQKPNAGAYVLSTRIRNDAYISIHKLLYSAGYKDTSSFVREAVSMKLKDLSIAVNDVDTNLS